MTPKILVYTCVFGGYDRTFPPVHPDSGVDYVLVTDDPRAVIPGWRTMVVDTARFGSRKAPNRYFKMLAHRAELAGYDVSVYVDGNIRVIGRTREFVSKFIDSGAAFGSYRHPFRNSVAEEVEQCSRRGQVASRESAMAELAAYRDSGFSDKQGLMETGVVLKNHHHPGLEPAMDLWWDLFERYDSRDQISLPYVQWKTGLPSVFFEPSYRLRNPYFGIYPHFGQAEKPFRYAYHAARSFDSPFHACVSWLWNTKWTIQRWARRFTRSNPSFRTRQ